MRRTNQGGSVLSFLIVGAVMVLLLLGGVYAVRHILLPNDTSGSITQNNGDSKSSAPSSDSQKEQANSSNNQPNQDKGQTSSNSDTKSAANQPTDAQPSSSDANQAASDLPTTGPGNTFDEAVMISTLVAIVLMYKHSRRQLVTL